MTRTRPQYRPQGGEGGDNPDLSMARTYRNGEAIHKEALKYADKLRRAIRGKAEGGGENVASLYMETALSCLPDSDLQSVCSIGENAVHLAKEKGAREAEAYLLEKI